MDPDGVFCCLYLQSQKVREKEEDDLWFFPLITKVPSFYSIYMRGAN